MFYQLFKYKIDAEYINNFLDNIKTIKKHNIYTKGVSNLNNISLGSHVLISFPSQI